MLPPPYGMERAIPIQKRNMDLSQDSALQERVGPGGAAGRFPGKPDGVAPVADRRGQPRLSGRPDGRTSDRRHEPRFPMTGSLRVGWVGADHQMRYVMSRGRDISEEGLGVWM